MNENSIGFVANATKPKARGVALNPLHEAAMRLAGMGMAGMNLSSRSREKTKDLVTLLLSHGARAWRHQQPPAQIHLHVGLRAGRAPVRMRLR
jgi:hypothetical protein